MEDNRKEAELALISKENDEEGSENTESNVVEAIPANAAAAVAEQDVTDAALAEVVTCPYADAV